MCIRALDYCPAVDITFGEYLRALITADLDAVPNDPLITALRSWNRSAMEAPAARREHRFDETLPWSSLDLAAMDHEWVRGLIEGIDPSWDQRRGRSEIFKLNEENRAGSLATSQGCVSTRMPT